VQIGRRLTNLLPKTRQRVLKQNLAGRTFSYQSRADKNILMNEDLAKPDNRTEKPESKQENNSPKWDPRDQPEKDFWEKFSSISTFLSTVLVALVGGFFTYTFNHREAEHQRSIQETQTVAQLMPYLTSNDQNTRRTAFMAVKVLQDTKLMADLAAADSSSLGAREALREVAFHANNAEDRNIALKALREVEFVPACSLPFDPIKQRHPIDNSCSADGTTVAGTPQSAQNDAKNNFCATGPPVNIDFAIPRQLQEDVAKQRSGITFGNDSQIPRDRSVLRNLPTRVGPLGEGKVVRLVAFVMDAHYSNLGKGESVNCKQPDKDSNDIHIVRAESDKEQDECNSVTAEMSPHFRPQVWDPTNLTRRNAHLYRFTGQLFFDASHRPCSGGKGSPKRSSLWEIHPVYALEICGDPNNNCKIDSDENWVSFAEQMGEEPSETRLWLPEEISSKFGARTRAERFSQ